MKLNTQAHLLKHKYINDCHQGPNICSRNLVNNINMKIETAAARYRHVFAMLRTLGQFGGCEWCLEFLKLRKQDVHGVLEAELPNALTQEHAKQLQERSLLNSNVVPKGNRTVSWIWRGSLGSSSDNQSGEDKFGDGWSFPSSCKDVCWW